MGRSTGESPPTAIVKRARLPRHETDYLVELPVAARGDGLEMPVELMVSTLP